MFALAGVLPLIWLTFAASRASSATPTFESSSPF